MKKSFFFFAMASVVALCNVSCSSDDDDKNDSNNNTSSVVIPAPANAENAVAYVIPKNTVKATEETYTDQQGEEVELCLTNVNITKGGKAVFETTETRVSSGTTKVNYTSYDVEVSGNQYKVKDAAGSTLGSIERVAAGTRATDSASLSVHVKIYIPGLGWVEFDTEDPVDVTAVTDAVASSVATTNFARLWLISRMKLTLVFDDKGKSDASRTENSGKLFNFIELAENNGVSLSDDDKRQLQKEIVSVDVDTNQALLTINYADGSSDAATWSWADSSQNKIRITLKDGEMGNKFLENDSQIEVQFPNAETCILILSTRLEDDGCTASLMINLRK
ncbi:MAG: hypothetical protein IJ612_02635 [Prevotella sp.]|nr:hypothetical protein [Prevotella sp.]